MTSVFGEAGLVVQPASSDCAVDWSDVAARVGADMASMTPPFVAFWFPNETLRTDAERVLSAEYRDVVAFEHMSAKFSRLARIAASLQPKPAPPVRPVLAETPDAIVYGECAHQRLPLCARSSAPTWRFEAFELEKAELVKHGIDVSVLGDARLSLNSGSVRIGVHGVDDAAARRVCDWILDQPKVAAVAEHLLWDVARERCAPEEITWGGLKLVAHSCLPDQPLRMPARGSWLQAMLWLGAVPTDSSAKSIADVARRAVASLLPLPADDVFAVVTSPTLPFIKHERLAPPPFIDLLNDNPQFEHRNLVPQADWPASVAKQIRARFDPGTLPATASFCWPKQADAALLFGLRNSETNRLRAAAAGAIVMSVAQRLPKQDLPTFEHAWTQVLTNADSDERSDQWVCAMLSGHVWLTECDLQKLVGTVTLSANLQVVDLCAAASVTAPVVNALLAISHVRVVAIAGVEGVEQIVKQCDPDRAQKLVWVRYEHVWCSGLSRERIDWHTAFYAFQYAALAAWHHGPCKQQETAHDMRTPER
jgi:hypothetical protein